MGTPRCSASRSVCHDVASGAGPGRVSNIMPHNRIEITNAPTLKSWQATGSERSDPEKLGTWSLHRRRES
jgi:hypothetical protein